MLLYLIFATLWTLYMAMETYIFMRPQGRPYFVGFLITNLVLAPFSFVLSISGGVLNDRIKTAYRIAFKEQEEFYRSGRKKLIG